MAAVRTLLIDNYDSFTYNLYAVLTEVNGREPTVVANDVPWSSVDLTAFDNVVVSPGPGRPDCARDFGISARALTDSGLPVLGVCLGHQGLCHVFGGPVVPAPEPRHGRISAVHHDGRGLFAGLPSPFRAVRYHSLAVVEVPDVLEVQAWSDDGVLMAVRHRELPLWGVQFHPESICSEYGRELLANFAAATPVRAPRPTRAARIPPTAAETEAPATKPRDRYRIRSVKVDRVVDPGAVYERLFAGGPNSYWLDGSAADEADGRFSVMGDCSGPRAEYVTYRVPEMTVRVEHSDGTVEKIRSTFFDYLGAQLRERSVAPRSDPPFGFCLGYVGYLGYELKADTGGQLAHASEQADAALVFADRAVVIDHERGCAYALALESVDGPDPDTADPDTARWLHETASTIDAMQDTLPEPPVTAPPLVPASEEVPIVFRHNHPTYLRLVEQCLAEIRSGETYEVCLTNTATVHRSLDPVSGYSCLREISPMPYNALLQFSGLSVLSASPERFLKVGADRTVESKPIKGTRPRSADPVEDQGFRCDLRASEKDRSENLMIVDLVRNDLSRVCVPGSVHVPSLFDIETYAPVHQMVSTVRGTLREGLSAVDCVRAAFPGGSMTGAPKIRTMEIIDKLEAGPRGVYSGAIGYFSLTGTADLSIVIRTMVATGSEVTFGVGGAIVALSDPDEEFEETMVKALTMRRCLSVAEESDP
ncbi:MULTISPECIES: aminodeoxychorismate synthase component I [Gordonia]|uniref:aminodeoxychorismate synthase n=1 Tax=Gordonia amicalis TaxID=89053 RepID=A0AAE4R7B4_9ACTN|nr:MULTISPECIES: aminodeoxychorismate synthase component I [Gordonia]ATD71238.1 aminodeoxychorismate synthase, component I [Gordonia sp. 1D]MCZ4581782.1 aminodeoxychorismate synthase component I [Gordonia amicalis]MCZ4652371.1 aminodeoxychorismate synthase component I [Gordonia amicalis]MDV6314364.1 aminodeoxychorismate synthase component I [Gordonia amicalis]UKO94082.1 aminodeoxychorismate synthase component I [Gordonia amicalis]